MKNRTPTDRPIPDFTPVPRRYRHDGWTAERQRAFIAALAETGSVTSAAARVNMAKEGAYQMRMQPAADSFRAAWAAALDHGVQSLSDIAIDRARDGVPVPIFHNGVQVGEKRWYNDRLLMFVLKHHMPHQYGGALPRGTRNPDTIAREAAANCPVCKAVAAVKRHQAESGEDKTTAEIFKRYEAKVRSERHLRLTGQIVAADFTLRQLTHIELILDCAGKTMEMIDLWTQMPPTSPMAAPVQLESSQISIDLDQIRRKVWAAAGEPPRPALPLHRRECARTNIGGGATFKERDTAQRAAEARIAEAQREWEAAATEEAWAAFKARGRRLSGA
ncbi:hypothetical protein [Sphingomonas bacterium]|uniref:hypothetical protein n=1 Tax=Sphingomonas bacterium TaxID=1895847 RepID=UPI0026031CB5|nr:hypothetical protein [Sphingomonas bacterium]MDB5678439.1 hypothetical protein [Sphingomonas bacterium]